MKSKRALLSILKLYPGNIFTWAALIISVINWGWKGLLGFYILAIILAVSHLAIVEDGRKEFYSKFSLGREDWLVQWLCGHSMHVWGNIQVEEPRTISAEIFLGSGAFGIPQRFRVGSGSCIFCDKKENFISFPRGNSARQKDHITWGNWTTMSKGFYEMYQEEQGADPGPPPAKPHNIP